MDILILLTIAMLSLASCGEEGDTKESSPLLSQDSKMLSLDGSIVSAFEVTVSGSKYPSIEDYHRYLVESLPAQVRDLGYDGYTAKLKAELGFNDLTSGMTVFANPVEETGHSGKAVVGSDGNFSLLLPKESVGKTYHVRANKRITVILEKDSSDSLRLCFNFSAINQEMLLGANTLPIKIDEFSASLTHYECGNESDSNLPLPTATVENTPNNTWIKIDKVNVFDIQTDGDNTTFRIQIVASNSSDNIITGLTADLIQMDASSVLSGINAGYISRDSFGCFYSGIALPLCQGVIQDFPLVEWPTDRLFQLSNLKMVVTDQKGRQEEFDIRLDL